VRLIYPVFFSPSGPDLLEFAVTPSGEHFLLPVFVQRVLLYGKKAIPRAALSGLFGDEDTVNYE